jgi:hypothetical protein
MRYIKEYHVHYAHYSAIQQGMAHQDFVKPFLPEHYEEAPYVGEFMIPNGGLPWYAALGLINKWNRQNASSGFTYWIE